MMEAFLLSIVILFLAIKRGILPGKKRLLYLAADGLPDGKRPVTQSAYQAEQIALIRRIHDQMMSDMSQRCTIEMLSQQYHINTSTLKSLFKTVYGQPLAAHMKEHRMEYAARLLRTTTDSLAEIAEKVGYESQSKLTAAFKSAYGVLPSEYRKEKKENSRP